MSNPFRPGDLVRCIDASLSSNRLTCGQVYQVFEPEGDYFVSIYKTIGSWETDRFEKVDAPESATTAPDAAAELEKIAKLLDELDVPFSHSDAYGRVRCLAAELARHKRDEWQNKHERLSGAIK